MALWPFRRKSAGPRSRSGAALSDRDMIPSRSQTEGLVRAASIRKQRAEPAKLHRRARTYSFSPDRSDSIHINRTRGPPSEANRHGQTPELNTTGNTWERTPTLHHPARRKSSKRRRDDHDREAEIKAMSSIMPARAVTEAWPPGHLTKQGSKRTKTMAVGRQWTNPASETSLPLPASIHSSHSSDSNLVSYKISALDSLAPRPTLRYGPGPRSTPSRASMPIPASSQKKPLAEREPIPEETLKAHKRIDDLADDFDASDLRELMERDSRRRERQRQHERENVERRLARKVEKQRKEEAEARHAGTPPPENLERGVMGREFVGLGIEPPSAVVTSSRPRTSPEPPSDGEEDSPRQPLDVFHGTDAPLLDMDEPISPETSTYEAAELNEPISALPPGSKLAGLLRSKKSKSKSTIDSEKEKVASPVDDDDAARKGSVASSKTNRLSFTNFLRWGGRSRRNSGGPSSFSNTSREEMQAAAVAQAQAQALARLQGDDDASSGQHISTGNYIASKIGFGTPKRTRSRFREDLPEFPLSPPDSRVQSPEAEPPLPMLPGGKYSEFQSTQPAPRYGTPTSGHHSLEGTRHIPIGEVKGHGTQPAEPHLSISLASIDSEASWLSGKVGSRRTSTLRDNLARVTRRDMSHQTDSQSNSTQEDLAIADDDFLSQLAPDSHAAGSVKRSFEKGRPSSDEDEPMEEANMRWGAVGAQAQLIHKQDRDTFHSREGLLNIESEDEEDLDSPVSVGTDDKADLQRATSIQVGKGHARNFSAGSAKLLEIAPRDSIDAKSKRASGSPLCL